MRKKLALLLVLSMIVSLFPVAVSACDGCHGRVHGHGVEAVNEPEPFVPAQPAVDIPSPFALAEVGIDAFVDSSTPASMSVGVQNDIITQGTAGTATFDITVYDYSRVPDGEYEIILFAWDGNDFTERTPDNFVSWAETLTITNGEGMLELVISEYLWVGTHYLRLYLLGHGYFIIGHQHFNLIVNPQPLVLTINESWQQAHGQWDEYDELIGIHHQFTFFGQAENFPPNIWPNLENALSFSGQTANANIIFAQLNPQPNDSFAIPIIFDDILPMGEYTLTMTVDLSTWFPGLAPTTHEITIIQDRDEDELRQQAMFRHPTWYVSQQLAPVRAGEFSIASFHVETRHVPDGRYYAWLHYWATQEDIDAGFPGSIGQWIALTIPGVVLSDVLYISDNEGIIIMVVTPDAQPGEHPFCVDMNVPGPFGQPHLLTSGTRWLVIDEPDENGGGQPVIPTGGVTFTYPDFPVTQTAYMNEYVDFHVGVYLVDEDFDFAVMHFVWLRDGQPWAGDGGGGTIPAATVLSEDFDGVRLHLEHGLSQEERGGNWTLQVSLIDDEGAILSTDTTRAAALNIALPIGGVTFDYVNFPPTASVNLNANHNFHIHAQLTPAGRNSEFEEMHFAWIRNGQVWTGTGGSGYISYSDVIAPNFGGVRLQLDGGLTHAQRGGEWTLQVTLVCYDGTVLFSDVTRTSVLTVTTPGGQQPPADDVGGDYTPAPTPTPTPESQDQPGDEDDEDGLNIVSTDDAAETIQEALDTHEEGEPLTIVFDLDGDDGISISVEDILALVELGAEIVIQGDGFVFALSALQLAALASGADSEVTFVVTPVAGGTFRPILRMAGGLGFILVPTPFAHLLSVSDITTARLNDLLMAELLDVQLFVDGEPVEMIPPGAMLSMDLSAFSLTMVQEARLTGIIFQDDTVYVALGGELENGIFSFPVLSPGLHGVMVEPTTVEVRLSIDSPVYLLNGAVQGSDIGSPFIDPASQRTMVPLRLIATALGAEINWIDETRTASISRNGIQILLPVDEVLWIGGENMGTPMMIDNRTFVPLRYVSEVLGAYVLWDAVARAAYVFE